MVAFRICLKAEVDGDRSTGMNWDERKKNYLKRHAIHKCHMDAVTKLKNQKCGSMLNILSGTP